MTYLSLEQTDHLTELCNIGMGRAAKQLSGLLSDDIHMTVPSIELTTLAEMHQFINVKRDDEMVFVMQRLSGALQGSVSLIFKSDSSEALTDVLMTSMIGEEVYQHSLEIEKEAMIEVGNVIISASVGTLANHLGEEVELSVPAYHLSTFDVFMSSVSQEADTEDTSVLLLSTELSAKANEISGMLAFNIRNESIERLLRVGA